MVVTTHVCRGNFRSTRFAEGGYEPVADALFNQFDYDGYFLEYDSARAGGFDALRFVPAGKKFVVLGLVTTKTGALEDAGEIAARIDAAARFVSLDRLCLSPQCGFASTEEGNLLSEDEQWAKLAAVVKIGQKCGQIRELLSAFGASRSIRADTMPRRRSRHPVSKLDAAHSSDDSLPLPSVRRGALADAYATPRCARPYMAKRRVSLRKAGVLAPDRSAARPLAADAARLESFVGYNLRRAAAKQRERFRSVFEPYDIRPVQLTVLTLLNDNGPLRQSALGRALNIERANVVTLLSELEDRKLILRRMSETDRRAYVVALTAQGEKLTRKLLALHAELEADLARAFGRAELEQLVLLLRVFRTVDSNPKLR
jgi:DNA-binding MarR family transcriptional regulator